MSLLRQSLYISLRPVAFSYGPAATLYPEPGEGDVQFTFETATNPAGPWTDCYGAIKPKIPSGDSYVIAPAPTSQAVAAGTWGRCRLISKTSGPVAALASVIPVVGGDTTYNSGTASLGLHPGPAIPANGQPGDIVVMIIALQRCFERYSELRILIFVG